MHSSLISAAFANGKNASGRTSSVRGKKGVMASLVLCLCGKTGRGPDRRSGAVRTSESLRCNFFESGDCSLTLF